MATRSRISNADLKKTSITFKTTSRELDRHPWHNPTTLIPSECEVLFIPKKDGKPDMENSYTRVARYMPGMRSIWQDEWSDIDVAKKGKKLKLTYGYLDVDVVNRNLLEYLRTSAYNEGNVETNINSSYLYKEINHEFDAKKAVKNERNVSAARNFVLNGDIDGVRAIALALATNKGQISSIHGMDEWTLRNSLRGVAEKNPDAFLGKMEDGSIKNKVTIVEALQKGLILADEVEGTISWASNNEIILEAAEGMSPIDYFAELSVNNDEYKNLLGNIKGMLNEANVTPRVAEAKAESLSWDETLVAEALESGTLIQKGQWFIVPGKEKDDDALFSTQGKKKLKVSILENEDNLIGLLSAKSS